MTHAQMLAALKVALARAAVAEPKLQAASEAWRIVRPRIVAYGCDRDHEASLAAYDAALADLDAALAPQVRDPVTELIILDPEATIDALLVAMSRAEESEQRLHVAYLAWLVVCPLASTRDPSRGWSREFKNLAGTLNAALARTEVTP